MNHLVKTSLALFISSTIIACSGIRGNFEVDDVIHPSESNKNANVLKDVEVKPRERVEQAEGIMKPAFGYEISTPIRNRHPNGTENTGDITLSSNNIKPLMNPDMDIPHLDEIIQEAGYAIYTHNPNGKKNQKREQYDHIKFGYVLNDEYRKLDWSSNIYETGPKGYIYFRGNEPSQSIPITQGKISYKGNWDFVTDINTQREQGSFDSEAAGTDYGATSTDESTNSDITRGDIGHTSEFEVDFSNKNLTGELYKNSPPIQSNKSEKINRYSIRAKISGNRFSGSATATNKEDLYFGDSSNFLEGGFYGPNAEELAGKFLTDNGSLFAVFGAKRDVKNNEEIEQKLDTVVIDITNNHGYENQYTFGEISNIVIDGVEYPLNPEIELTNGSKRSILESGLVNLKFGSMTDKKENKYWLYFQGERTSLKDMQSQPEGLVVYKGKWDGNGSVNGVNWNRLEGNLSEFNVNFADKQLSGILYDEIDNKGNIKAFNLIGNINKNGFTGLASTFDEYNVDNGSELGGNTINFKDVSVNGGFFGPNANELGGHFYYNKDNTKIGVVFGATRQQSGN
ncbi:transferrin-binding protein-like solute binding protein [Otariodibacter oris]|uniref:Transferrin-binding protein B n=1 Tax=Otariodibacter oris TaxID=1032623 RepID=A0A420XHM2_9PAST|nr:transferrin-binding protein-like solute binding protein [Otariodibacter oris]QGM80995.1 hypothetical protein A6A10_06040 [Otariodibacter oris]RKR76825.1 transferrin binding protein [Otariodibacter oris]